MSDVNEYKHYILFYYKQIQNNSWIFSILFAFYNMSGRKTIEEFLVQIDEDLVTYAGEFRKQGFTSNNSMKHWREADFELINLPVPEGHRRLIMNAVLAMSITPPAKTKRKNRPSVGESPETKAYCSESVAKYGACSATSTSRKSLISSRRRLTVSDETPNFKLLDHDSDDDGGIDDLIAANIRPKVDKKTDLRLKTVGAPGPPY